MRPTYFRCQNTREDNFWKEIVRLQKGAHLASLGLINTLMNHSLHHRNGNGFVAATSGTPAFQRSCGLELILRSVPCSCIESCMCQSTQEETSQEPSKKQKKATKSHTECSTPPAGKTED